MNSRDKGARGEREFAQFLRDAGYDARRGQQFAGSPESPDVICGGLEGCHIECKRTERLNLYDAMAQATEDAGDKIPIVAHRRNRHPWVVVMNAEDFLKLVGNV